MPKVILKFFFFFLCFLRAEYLSLFVIVVGISAMRKYPIAVDTNIFCMFIGLQQLSMTTRMRVRAIITIRLSMTSWFFFFNIFYLHFFFFFRDCHIIIVANVSYRVIIITHNQHYLQGVSVAGCRLLSACGSTIIFPSHRVRIRLHRRGTNASRCVFTSVR